MQGGGFRRTSGRGPNAIDRTARTAPPDLVRLTYVSSATRPLSAVDLDLIAATSKRNNDAHGLTGLLICGGTRFYGVLEGPRRVLFARMEKIVVDPRHRSARIIREDAIETRRFANWTFARMSDTDDDQSAPGVLDDFILGLVGRL